MREQSNPINVSGDGNAISVSNGNNNTVNSQAVSTGKSQAEPAMPTIHTSVFISYRRSPSRGLVEALYHQLSTYIANPEQSIFLDVKSLGGGTFPGQIREAVRRSRFFLSIISPGTFDRIGEPDDWVRQEILEAIAAGCTIIPVLEEDTPLPANLPPELAPLLRWNGTRIRYDLFEASVKLLVERRILPVLNAPR